MPTTKGILHHIRKHSKEGNQDTPAWIINGEIWFDEMLDQLFSYKPKNPYPIYFGGRWICSRDDLTEDELSILKRIIERGEDVSHKQSNNT